MLTKLQSKLYIQTHFIKGSHYWFIVDSSDICWSCHIIRARAVCCIKCRLSISQLKSCSQDSFPAGLRSSVVPLHPVDLRSTQACQTEYTLIAPDWKQQIFVQLLDITEANKLCNQFTILNQHKMLGWTLLNKTACHYNGMQLQKM